MSGSAVGETPRSANPGSGRAAGGWRGAAAPARRNLGERVFAGLALGSGLTVLVLLGAIIASLAIGGWPAFRAFGPGFLTTAEWDPVHGQFGALVPIFGTLVTSLLALALAVPFAFGIAWWLADLAPVPLRRPVGIAIELLAAIPSIIYGVWGFFFVVPLMAGYVQPLVEHAVEGWPVLGVLFSGPPFGTGLATAAMILALMILPFIAATLRDVFATVPPVLREAAYGLGCTRFEVMRLVVLPATRGAAVGAVMLGLGRALGETMAVTFVIGNTNRLSESLFGPGNTIASLVALEFAEATPGTLKFASLLASGFLLFAITFVVLALSRLLVRGAGPR